jgi:quinoprotein glucose dehydrogenase
MMTRRHNTSLAWGWAFALATFIAFSTAVAGDDQKGAAASGPPSAPYAPRIAPASEEARRAMRSFRVPGSLEVELFAAEPLLANPVAFHVDEKGVVYVAETFRHGAGGDRHPRAHELARR